ncbi:ABC transporter ATP-binding protein [Microvirga alba]|uniref:ABC transporter ATP-binding protein n=1 Tax=Microvirga alba TaxID=2791025 RepID=A0A931BQB7_9HYPH|nr:ABC transporter ATP-binding protein [Microvirga alba]MBF9235501.1 ABC transporter ATP-binding protein [Microvirga alba]
MDGNSAKAIPYESADSSGVKSPSAVSRKPSGDIAISVQNVFQIFKGHEGKPFTAVEDVSIDVPAGQFLAIVGPSGCGKTTVLNMMAGLVAPSKGQVYLNNEEVKGPSRSMGYMFARDALLPWRTARDNVEFGLELRGVPADARRARSQKLLKLVGLSKFENAYPSQLSQGMRQRVALARTMAIEPDIFLLDEPFAALDAQTKLQLESEFELLWQDTHKTAVLVTHDLDEAVALADRILVFGANPGRIILDRMTNLPRPRNVESIRYMPEFQVVAREIWELLRSK